MKTKKTSLDSNFKIKNLYIYKLLKINIKDKYKYIFSLNSNKIIIINKNLKNLTYNLTNNKN